jgi:hypothetical protein
MAARKTDSETSKLLNHLAIWLIAVGVELVSRKVLEVFGPDIGFSIELLQRTHAFMSVLLWVTLMSTAIATAAEVVSLGLRRLLRELTSLVRQVKIFRAAFSNKRGER